MQSKCIYIILLYMYCNVPLISLLLKTVSISSGAPKKLLDAGKAFLGYFEAVKKEYDVCKDITWRSQLIWLSFISHSQRI